MITVLSDLAHLRRSQGWSDRRSESAVLDRLRKLVANAARHVPFYADSFRAAGIDVNRIRSLEDFSRLPILTGDDIRANFPDRFVSRRFDVRRLHRTSTSGTTDRLMLFQDDVKRNWDRAADLLMALQSDGFRPGQRQAVIPADACYERCGADAHGRVESLGSRLRKMFVLGSTPLRKRVRSFVSQLVRDFVWREKFFKALGIDGSGVSPSVLEEYVTRLREWRPHVLSGLPFFLYVIAEHAGGAPTKPIASIIRPSGGKLTEHMIAIVEAALGGRVRENFGTAELGTIAFDCPMDRRQHLLEQLFHVEFIRAGATVGPGELGELVITDLQNFASPLIRYRVGDVGRYFAESCVCGRGRHLFTVDSRSIETVVTTDGRAYSGDRIIDVFLRREDVRFARVTQESDELFTVEIVPARGAPLAGTTELSNDLSLLLGERVRVIPRQVQRIVPERSGKYRLVVSRSYSRLREPKARRQLAAPAVSAN